MGNHHVVPDLAPHLHLYPKTFARIGDDGADGKHRFQLALDIFEAHAFAEELGETFEAACQSEVTILVHSPEITRPQHPSLNVSERQVGRRVGVPHHHILAFIYQL